MTNGRRAMNGVAPARDEGDPGPRTLREARDRFEQTYVLRALEREGWNQSRAARSLGVHRYTLITRLAAWGFHRDEPESASAPRPEPGNDSPGRG